MRIPIELNRKKIRFNCLNSKQLRGKKERMKFQLMTIKQSEHDIEN